jgi:hypothetical protein
VRSETVRAGFVDLYCVEAEVGSKVALRWRSVSTVDGVAEEDER